MIILTTSSPDARPTAIDITAAAGVAALTILPKAGDATCAVLNPGEARRVSDELATFAERHGA
ncbi:MAG: hypothetical protein ACRDM7_17470 [Thermoleophilaceae bacterium]